MMQNTHDKTIVVGYGSTLRGDDAVGRAVVERIADLDLQNVVAISSTQLAPELAQLIAFARDVVFVDACAEASATGVEVRQLDLSPRVVAVTHHFGPGELLQLASACYGKAPPAWLVAVPAKSFALSDSCSTAARAAIQSAMTEVLKIVEVNQRAPIETVSNGV